MGLSLQQNYRFQKNKGILSSIIYHDIFDYPLTADELQMWKAGKIHSSQTKYTVVKKKGYFLLKGREGIILKRLDRLRASKKKLKIAQSAANLLAKISSVKMVGVTGALAMNNAENDSDIDLLIITSQGTLWTTRAVAIFWLLINGFKLRRAGSSHQKDRLCLNIWMDESDLVIRKRNVFTAHEISQITPLLNKDSTYQKFLWRNRWILKYWPNKAIIKQLKFKYGTGTHTFQLFENLAYKIQYLYMSSKITRETVSKRRAFFHPFDWSKLVAKKYKVQP